MYSHGANQTFLIGTTHLKEKEHLEGGRIEGENIKAKLQTGEFGLDMAEYMGEYKIMSQMKWEYPKVCVNLQTDVR